MMLFSKKAPRYWRSYQEGCIQKRNHPKESPHNLSSLLFLVAHTQSTCNFSRVWVNLLHFFSPCRISNIRGILTNLRHDDYNHRYLNDNSNAKRKSCKHRGLQSPCHCVNIPQLCPSARQRETSCRLE